MIPAVFLRGCWPARLLLSWLQSIGSRSWQQVVRTRAVISREHHHNSNISPRQTINNLFTSLPSKRLEMRVDKPYFDSNLLSLWVFYLIPIWTCKFILVNVHVHVAATKQSSMLQNRIIYSLLQCKTLLRLNLSRCALIIFFSLPRSNRAANSLILQKKIPEKKSNCPCSDEQIWQSS